jgi:hypothetical protein
MSHQPTPTSSKTKAKEATIVSTATTCSSKIQSEETSSGIALWQNCDGTMAQSRQQDPQRISQG